jgi:hypothetical protein
MEKLPYIIGLIAAVVLSIGFSGGELYKLPPGRVAPDPPLQQNVSFQKKWKKGDFVITPLATFEINARVIRRARYYFDSSASLSPVDLVLGWGPLSDSTILNKITFSQGGRFYYWSTKTPPVSKSVIKTHTANMHMIPANDKIRSQLLKLRTDDVVTLKGYLIRADRADGRRWVSSLTRQDSGPGACEVVWVEELL